MSRLLLLPLALFPAAFAAPVPRDAGPDFAAGGLLTRADLEKVRFDSQPVKDGERGALAGDEKDEPEAKSDGPARPKNRYDVAVHMPATRFREGDPVPAYFVLRNNRGTMLGLGSRLEFTGSYPMLHGGDCDFDVRDRATGESVLTDVHASTHCGGGHLVEVPAGGYYVVKADLTRVTKRLPPGEYEVDWRYGRLRSTPVPFTVVARNPTDPKPVRANRPALHFYHVAADSDGEAHLGHVHAASMAAALAVGPDGAFVPDVRTIPSADKLVEVTAQWKPYRDGDRLAVTFRSASATKRVVFSEMPHLYLQIEASGEAGPESLPEEAAKEGDAKARELTTPLTVEVRLPTDWRERVGLSGALCVSVLVTSKRLEFPVGHAVERLQKAVELRAVSGGERPPVWSGALRTESAELRFPPPAPQPVPRIEYIPFELLDELLKAPPP